MVLTRVSWRTVFGQICDLWIIKVMSNILFYLMIIQQFFVKNPRKIVKEIKLLQTMPCWQQMKQACKLQKLWRVSHFSLTFSQFAFMHKCWEQKDLSISLVFRHRSSFSITKEHWWIEQRFDLELLETAKHPLTLHWGRGWKPLSHLK